MTKLSAILDQIDGGTMLLPEFQRGYVWNRDQVLCWSVHAAVRDRFTGSTETMLARDLETVDREGVDGLVAALRRIRAGRLTIDPQDLEGAGRGSRS